MKIRRNFGSRSASDRQWFTENTWCDTCGEADLGLVSPEEYEQNGRIFVEGRCARCGALVTTEEIVRETRE